MERFWKNFGRWRDYRPNLCLSMELMELQMINHHDSAQHSKEAGVEILGSRSFYNVLHSICLINLSRQLNL